ncbi:MAG: 6-phosphogluconolactonase [Kofleriaceae bacterium]|nr:6-phosphogluconolactonase [Kofleriaceae bacterium]
MSAVAEVCRHPDAATLAADAAARVEAALAAAVAARGRASIALAGGSTPRPLYARLAAARAGAIAWDRVDVYFGDERAVPPDDAASNFRMARETLLRHVPVPRDQVHRIEGERPADDAARRYAEIVAAALPLDVVLLGMGDDGHTASLFPATADLDPGPPVIVTTSPVAPATRISLALGAINRARAVIFLVAGAGKAARLAEVFAQRRAGAPTLPAARVAPTDGTLTWLVDDAAAARLDAEGAPR